MKPPLAFLLITVLVLASCSPPGPTPTYIPPTVPTLAATGTSPPAATATLLPTISPTPDPYYNWSNAYLRSRTYGGGQVEFLEVMDQNLYFTRYLIRYPSDG
ncbi:MAG TPA: hypothetical protein VFY26_16215, partial [Anaerolineales bacterium]|nr:hypothetical protein [Anaerolineales bacterium]